MNAETFASRWLSASVGERQAAQSHFIDLCRPLDVLTPIEAEPTGATYAFEKSVSEGGPWSRLCPCRR
jgi:hypothetical protein